MIEYEDSAMARKDGGSKVEIDYNNDDSIFNVDIGAVLLALQTDSRFYIKPTKEGLKEALLRLKNFYVELFESDWDFYAEHVIPKFLKGVKK
jgi:hypothetical protein